MEQHSGLNYEQMLETAIRVQEQLRAVNGPELSLIFMNSAEIPEAPPRRENIPLIVDLEKWQSETQTGDIGCDGFAQGSEEGDAEQRRAAAGERQPGVCAGKWRGEQRTS